MKRMLNVLLVMAFCCAAVFAEGDMGGGGYTCQNCPPPCTVNCGGFAAEDDGTTIESTEETQSDEKQSTDSVLSFIQEYLSTMF